MQAVVPCGANEPAGQAVHAGAAPESHDQLLSTLDLTRNWTPGPALPAAHAKV
jgi:hypothetical protein